MKIRANILSKTERVNSLEWLRGITGSVPAYHQKLERVVGGTVPGSIAIDGDDVWAELEIEDGTPIWKRVIGMVVDGEAGRELVVVVLTDVPREQLKGL